MSGFDFLLDKGSNASRADALPHPVQGTGAPGGSAIRREPSHQAAADLPKISSSVEGASRNMLDRADRELLNALAAYQIRYGKPEEALAFLQLTNRLWPEDAQTLRLLSQAFLALEDYSSAEMTEDAYRRVSRAERATRADLLRQAIIHFGHLRLHEARQSLSACFALNRHEG